VAPTPRVQKRETFRQESICEIISREGPKSKKGGAPSPAEGRARGPRRQHVMLTALGLAACMQSYWLSSVTQQATQAAGGDFKARFAHVFYFTITWLE